MIAAQKKACEKASSNEFYREKANEI